MTFIAPTWLLPSYRRTFAEVTVVALMRTWGWPVHLPPPVFE